MGRVWVAILCVTILVIIAAGWVFYATAGAPWLAERLSSAAQNANPGWSARLYRWALAINPFDTEARIQLSRLYREYGRDEKAITLLRQGVDQYAVGPTLHLELAALYADRGQLETACSLLDNVRSDYIAKRLSELRPDNAAAPPSGTYAVGLPFVLSGGEGFAWYQLNGGPWTMYAAPLALQEGRHKLRVVTLNEQSIPSPVAEYHYTMETLQPASASWHMVLCPFCGESWAAADQ